MNLFDVFKKKNFEELLEKVLEEQLSIPQNDDEIYSEIVNNYFMLLSLLNVNRFNLFQFPDYEDCRRAVVDGIEYDFDNAFCHDDSEAIEALCAIDCLMADLEEHSVESILKETEKRINIQNNKRN